MMMNRKLAKRMLRRGESGIALISVLLLIATGSLLALMVMSISKTTSFTVMPFVQLQRSYYVLEGMAQRIQFLISADRQLYGTPQQLNVDRISFLYAGAQDSTVIWIDEWDREEYDFIPLAVQMTVEWKDGTEECWLRRTAASGGNSVYGALQEIDE